MKKLLLSGIFAAGFAASASAQGLLPPDPPAVVKEAISHCAGMPACIRLVNNNTIPARFIIACSTAMDMSIDSSAKVNSIQMCEAALESIEGQIAGR